MLYFPYKTTRGNFAHTVRCVCAVSPTPLPCPLECFGKLIVALPSPDRLLHETYFLTQFGESVSTALHRGSLRRSLKQTPGALQYSPRSRTRSYVITERDTPPARRQTEVPTLTLQGPSSLTTRSSMRSRYVRCFSRSCMGPSPYRGVGTPMVRLKRRRVLVTCLLRKPKRVHV